MSKRRRSHRRQASPPRPTPLSQQGSYFARGRPVGRDELVERTPELHVLRDATLLVVGLGALGAPSVLEFARAGVQEIRVIDFDHVDPGTIVRWPLGLRAAGWQKVNALQGFVQDNWPYSKIVPLDHRLGSVRLGENDESDLDVMSKALTGVSLIYDATTEMGVGHFLSDAARDAGIPYVTVWATPGGWGGLAARVRPDPDAPCWLCLRYGLDDGSIPSPPGDPSGEIQPVGCADPTFTGAGFDLSTVALHGVRLAIGTMCEDAGGYPSPNWDVVVISNRNSAGDPAPSLVTMPLEYNVNCPACRQAPAVSG